jgi:hypothetical protein
MYSKPMVWRILGGLLLVAVLAGCGIAPTATATSTPVPTVDTKPTFDAVSTQAAQTVIANLTLNAPTATPVTPTNTPAPTNTPVPTETPAPTSTATRAFIPWTQTPTPTQAAYACTVTDVSPKSSDTIKVDQDFDGKWSLKNTGTKTWLAGNTDIRYSSGTKFQQGGDLVDLNSDVAPNGTYTVTIDMKAPSSDGTYNTSWGLVLEDGTVCALNLTINVSK